MSWVTIIRGKDISKHAEGGAGSGILLTSATPLHASLVCGTSTMARTAGERHFRITSLCAVPVAGLPGIPRVGVPTGRNVVHHVVPFLHGASGGNRHDLPESARRH